MGLRQGPQTPGAAAMAEKLEAWLWDGKTQRVIAELSKHSEQLGEWPAARARVVTTSFAISSTKKLSALRVPVAPLVHFENYFLGFSQEIIIAVAPTILISLHARNTAIN